MTSSADSHTGDLLRAFTASATGVQQLVFSPDSQRLAGAVDEGARIWDVTTGKQQLAFAGHGAGVRTSGIAFSPNGQWLATTSNDATVQVWEAATGIVIFRLTGHTGPTFGVAFSPDGQMLATSSVDRTIKLWQLASKGEAIASPLPLYGNTGAVYRIAFSPDNTRLATAGRDLVGHVYALRLAALVALAQTRVTRTLTLSECQKFLHMNSCPINP